MRLGIQDWYKEKEWGTCIINKLRVNYGRCWFKRSVYGKLNRNKIEQIQVKGQYDELI
jgi:hypothetical protein